MRSVPCIVVLACLFLPAVGCQLSNKKDSAGTGGGPFLGSSGGGDKAKGPESGDPLAGGAAGSSTLEGLLAGKVIDAKTGQPTEAQIRWVCLDDPKDEEAPIDVAVDRQGYFMIQGLKSGKQYRLVARSKTGDRLMTGVSITRVPNVHMLIRVSEDFTLPGTPLPGKQNDKNQKKPAAPAADAGASLQAPGFPPGVQQATPATLPPPNYGIDASKIAANPAIKPPLASVPGAKPASPENAWHTSPEVSIAPPVPNPLPSASAAAPVPSCVLVGKKLENFALMDISFTPWEYRARKHKLVLLDFWMTNCVPCRDAIYVLRNLQDKYGPLGLEVVGIAYEDGSLPEQAHRVTQTAQLLKTNYQLLLGAGKDCPVKRSFQVQRFPTLVLVDDNGMVIWQHEGALTSSRIEDLDFAIKKRVVR